MRVKTNELTGAALDWAVAKCEGRQEPEVVNNFAREAAKGINNKGGLVR